MRSASKMRSPLNNPADTAALAHLFPLTKPFNQNSTKGRLRHRASRAQPRRRTHVHQRLSCLQYLCVAVEGGVVQGGASAAVRHVHAAQQRDEDLGAPQGVVGSGDVQRRLPVLVTCVHVCRVTDQNSHSVLRKKVGWYKHRRWRSLLRFDTEVKLKTAGDLFRL